MFRALPFRSAALIVLTTTLMVGGLTSCNSSTDSPRASASSSLNQRSFALSAGMREIPASDVDSLSPMLDLGRLSVDGFERVYRLTTPASEPFRFSLVARAEGNAGMTTLNVAHAAINMLVPNGGIETVALEGMQLDAPGMSVQGNWCEVVGDGFARLNITGAIQRDQVLVVEIPNNDGGKDAIAIDIRIGEESDINRSDDSIVADAVPLSNTIVYSSPSNIFGLPAVAVSGDRYSIVAYDGDHNEPYDWTRDRVWLQFDPATMDVFGGASLSTSPDSGFWRDQEVAALGNVIAVVYTGNGETRVDISLDRGISFPVQQVLASNSTGLFGQRLVNIAIAEDYTMNIVFWESSMPSGSDDAITTLKMVTASSTGLDGNNTPLGYTFAPAQSIHSPGKDVTPMVMEVEQSAEGDVVVGYGYTTFEPIEGQPFTRATASFLCSTKKSTAEVFNTILVDSEEGVMPTDPSISLLGSGTDLKVFYAYEKSTGVFLAYSDDCGDSFQPAAQTGSPGANYPSVRARFQGTDRRVDLLYLEQTSEGFELHDLRWTDFQLGASLPVLERITIAESTDDDIEVGDPIFLFAPTGTQKVVTDVAQFGYDAVLDGDDVVVVVHEHTRSVYSWLGMPQIGFGAGGFGANLPFFGAAEGGLSAGATVPPAILLPGMGGVVPAPNPDHQSQLRLIVLD